MLNSGLARDKLDVDEVYAESTSALIVVALCIL